MWSVLLSFHLRRKYLPFCPREQCPLHVFSLESSRVVSSFTVLAQGDPFCSLFRQSPAGTSIAWRLAGHSRKVTPLFLVCHKTPARHSFFFFSSPLCLSFSMSCYILFYLFIFLSFFHSNIGCVCVCVCEAHESKSRYPQRTIRVFLPGLLR